MEPYEKALRMSRSGLDNPPTRRLRSEGLLIGSLRARVGEFPASKADAHDTGNMLSSIDLFRQGLHPVHPVHPC